MATTRNKPLSRGRIGMFVLPVALSAAAVATLLSAQAAPAFEARGKITYGYRLCTKARHVHNETLRGALVVLRDRKGNLAATAQTDATGRFSAEVGSKPVTAELQLDQPGEFMVTQDGSKPYRFGLGEFTRRDPSKSVGFTHESAGGSMNIFNALGVGAEVAGDLAFQAGPTKAIWDPQKNLKKQLDIQGSGSHYAIAPKRIFIDGEGRKPGDEWEPWVVLHEYGHHILWSLRAVGGKATTSGSHYLNLAYPDAPALAWSEGFADAFGTLAQDSGGDLYDAAPGIGRRDCGDYIDLGATPPRPTPPADDPQYNETAGAAVVWGLAAMLGGGEDLVSRGIGVRSLVRIARSHYRPPEDMHDVRDALTSVPGVEEGPVDHERIDKVFGERGHMAWGKSAVLLPTEASGGAYELHLRLEGPAGYVGCAVTDETQTVTLQGTGEGPYPGKMAPGGLDYTWHDDCLISSGDGTIGGSQEAPSGGSPTGQLLMDFPFLSGGAHRAGPFKLYATWLCQDIPENGEFPGSFCNLSLQHQALACSPVNPRWFDPCSRAPVGTAEAPVTLERNASERLLLEFTADGRECWLYGNAGVQDCTTGKAW